MGSQLRTWQHMVVAIIPMGILTGIIPGNVRLKAIGAHSQYGLTVTHMATHGCSYHTNGYLNWCVLYNIGGCMQGLDTKMVVLVFDYMTIFFTVQ